jgi:hypothetical protein
MYATRFQWQFASHQTGGRHVGCRKQVPWACIPCDHYFSPYGATLAGGAGDASAKDGSSAPAPTTLQGAASEPAGKKTRPRAFRVEPLDSNASAAATAALLALARISPVVKRQVEAELLFQEVSMMTVEWVWWVG